MKSTQTQSPTKSSFPKTDTIEQVAGTLLDMTDLKSFIYKLVAVIAGIAGLGILFALLTYGPLIEAIKTAKNLEAEQRTLLYISLIASVFFIAVLAIYAGLKDKVLGFITLVVIILVFILSIIFLEFWINNPSVPDNKIPSEPPQMSQKNRYIYLSYPHAHAKDVAPLVEAIKLEIQDSGYKVLLPPTRNTKSEDIRAKLDKSLGVIVLYIPFGQTVYHQKTGDEKPLPQEKPSAWLNITVGAARVATKRPLPVLAIQDKRIEVSGLARTETFVYQRAYDPNDPSTLEAIKSYVREQFLEKLLENRTDMLLSVARAALTKGEISIALKYINKGLEETPKKTVEYSRLSEFQTLLQFYLQANTSLENGQKSTALEQINNGLEKTSKNTPEYLTLWAFRIKLLLLIGDTEIAKSEAEQIYGHSSHLNKWIDCLTEKNLLSSISSTTKISEELKKCPRYEQTVNDKQIYLSYPHAHLTDTTPLVEAIKQEIQDAGYKVLLPPKKQTTSEDLRARLDNSLAVIVLYIPFKQTVYYYQKTDDEALPQEKPSAWLNTTVGAARIATKRPLPVLAIQDKRVEVFGLARTEVFVYQRAYDPNDPSTLEAIKSYVHEFIQQEI
jgi:hypothetical protein